MQCINCSTVIYSVRVGSALAVMRYSRPYSNSYGHARSTAFGGIRRSFFKTILNSPFCCGKCFLCVPTSI